MNQFKIISKKFLWVLPFISFLLGYYLAISFLETSQIEVPTLIGTNLNEASKILSDCNLNLRILGIKEDSDLPDGTIIDQNPIRQKIKSNKPIYLTVSQRFKEFKIPNFKGKNLSEIQNILKKAGIKNKIYYIDNIAPEKTCICQYPEHEKFIEKKEKMILYISNGDKKPILIPDFKGLELKQVMDFLEKYEIKPTIFVNNWQQYDSKKLYKILDQRPIAGSIIQLNKNINIQLQVMED